MRCLAGEFRDAAADPNRDAAAAEQQRLSQHHSKNDGTGGAERGANGQLLLRKRRLYDIKPNKPNDASTRAMTPKTVMITAT